MSTCDGISPSERPEMGTSVNGEGEFKKGGGKSVNWLMNYFSLFSSVFSSLAALIFSSLTNFPPFFAFEFEFNSIEYNNKPQDLEARQDKTG